MKNIQNLLSFRNIHWKVILHIESVLKTKYEHK